jgi:CspA family cold shock protein
MARERATVIWFNKKKGFGFLQASSGPDVFVHFSGIDGSGYRNLEADQVVEFERIERDGRATATNVQVVGGGGQ